MVVFLPSSHFTFQGVWRDAVRHFSGLNKPLRKHLSFGDVTSVLNPIPVLWTWDEKAVQYEAAFPGIGGEAQRIFIAWTMAQGSGGSEPLLSVLLNAN